MELDTFEFDASTMEEITTGVGEKNVDEILGDSIVWDADSGNLLKALDDILCPETLKQDNDEDDSIDEKVVRGKENFENFTDLLVDLEEDGEDLCPIIIRSHVDNSSLSLITPVDLPSKLEESMYHTFPLAMVNSKESEFIPLHETQNRNKNPLFISPLNKIYPRRVSQSLEKSMYQNFPVNMKNSNEPELIAVHDVKYQSKNPQFTSPLHRIYPRRVSQSSDIPSSIPLHHRNTLNAYSHANSSIPTPTDVLQQQMPFNVIPNIVPSSAVRKEIMQKPVQSKANVKYQDLSKTSDKEAARNCNYKNMRGRTREPFPVKLHSIIERSEEDEYSMIISWAPHGRAFKIHNEVLFVGQLLPTYFFQSKMSSFTRQLRMYGYQKIKGKYNVDKGSYFHELFLRGRPGLACGLARLNSPCAAFRQYEPNLYDFPPMPCSKPCDQSESSPSNDETAKEKNSINLRTIRYVSSSLAASPTNSNVSRIAVDANDENREENEQSIVPDLPMLEKKVLTALSELPSYTYA